MAQETKTLEARIEELEKNDRAKDQFLALLSHELRNHIHAIRTNVWLIKARNRDPEIGRPSDASVRSRAFSRRRRRVSAARFTASTISSGSNGFGM